MSKILIFIVCVFLSSNIYADGESLQVKIKDLGIGLSMNVEVEGLGEAINTFSKVNDELVGILQQISNDQELNETDKIILVELANSLQESSQEIRQTVHELPQTVKAVNEPIQNIVDKAAENVKTKIITINNQFLNRVILLGIILGSILLLILVILAYLIIKPIKGLSSTVREVVTRVENISMINHETMQILDNIESYNKK